MASKKSVIAVLGPGVVGSSVIKLIRKYGQELEAKTGLKLEIKYIFGRSFKRLEAGDTANAVLSGDLAAVINDDEVETVVELLGGLDFAEKAIRMALEKGKKVVTANKALLAVKGKELFALARKNNTSISFEASCAGGIPIIRALYDGLAANRIDALYGIVNGTCNYILTQMIQKNQSYAEALKGAQKEGFAEADPTLDVNGTDSAHKLAILASLAFGESIDFNKITIQGIDTLQPFDVNLGLELGYVVKLLAVAQRMDTGLSLRVRPAFISREHPLAWVSGPFNAVSVYGNAVGHSMYYGRGAGGYPTASAVISDIISAGSGMADRIFHSGGIWPDISRKAVQLAPESIMSRYYIRIMVKDKPGVFAEIAGVLGSFNISISSALQKENTGSTENQKLVPIVITTHQANEGSIKKALEKINRLDIVAEESVCINILDEHEETLS